MSTNRDWRCRRCVRSVVHWLSCSLLLVGLSGQNGPQWLPGDGVPGVDRAVFGLHRWDPDGAGPASPQLVIGGRFSLANQTITSGIAAVDLVSGAWSKFGGGVGQPWYSEAWVWCFATDAQGGLIAAGNFQTADTVQARGIARWNGTGWAALGAGLNGPVHSVLVLRNGDIVAGGEFTMAGGAPASRIARWDGNTWSPMGSGMNGDVYALVQLTNGDVVAGGAFLTAGGVPASRLARWNGQAWSSLGGVVAGSVFALAEARNRDLIVGGQFSQVAGVADTAFVARWNSSGWYSIAPTGTAAAGLTTLTGAGADGVYTMMIRANGDVVVGGTFLVPGGSRRIAVWNGTAWNGLDTGTNEHVLAVAQGLNQDLFAGGWFTLAGEVGVGRLALWNGGWRPIARGFNGSVNAMVRRGADEVVAGGCVTRAGRANAHYVARWDGVDWQALGRGVDDYVYAVAVTPTGDVIAGGRFTMAGGQPANRIARWDGTSWWPMGTGMDDWVYALAVLANGDVVAGGLFTRAGGVVVNQIARWDGAQWRAMAGGTNGGTVTCLKTLRNGDLIAGGGFGSMAGGLVVNGIARWNGTAWLPLGAGLPVLVGAVTEMDNGDLVAVAPTFVASHGSNLARWTGAAWTAFTPALGSVMSLGHAANGDLVVGRVWIPPAPAPAFVVRNQGTQWSVIAGDVNFQVGALTSVANGDLFVGGAFLLAAGRPSAYLARARDVAAAVEAYGGGCSGSAGPLALAATVFPLEGGNYESRATGMPAAAVAVSVLGFQPTAVPLPLLLPEALAGCDLLASLDRIDLAVPAAGVASFTLAVVATPSLIGVPLYHQVLAAEFDPNGALLEVSSTNGLLLTIGRF